MDSTLTPSSEADFAALDAPDSESTATPEAAPSPTPAVPAAQPALAPAAAPVVPPTVPPTPPAQPVVAQPVPPQPPPQPSVAPQPIPTQPGTPQLTQEQQVAAIMQQRASLVNEIALRYTMSEQDAELAQTDPQKFWPAKIGQLYVDIFDGIYQAMQSQMPKMVLDIVGAKETSNAARDSFYKKWPQLNKDEYKPHIERIAQMYSQFNPRATQEQAFQDIGIQAITALRIPLDQIMAANPAGAAQPPQPPVPVLQGGYRPASPTGAVPQGSPSQAKSVWEELGDTD